MITDILDNITNYNIPIEAIEFIKNLSSQTKTGRYEINDKIYANVEKYLTKSTPEGKFEAHNKYIDIQILLDGCEKIYYTQRNTLNISEPYDENRDIMFYSNNIEKYPYIKLNGKNFVVLYPHEAHAPQISVDDNSQNVIKVVIKIRV